jgi:hypothetical protein
MAQLKIKKIEMVQMENARLRGELAETRKNLYAVQKVVLEQRIENAKRAIELLKVEIPKTEAEEAEARELFDSVRLGIEQRLGVQLADFECDADSGVLNALPAKE